jgi:hypothetical protein
MNTPAGTMLELRDIHAAPAPGLWPPAPGWWALAILLAVLLVLGLLWLRRRYHARRFRRQVMLELEDITDRYKDRYDDGFFAETGIWLRRVALHRYPPEQVASLTGSAWLEFLDATGGAGEFRTGAGQVLETGPYRPEGTAVAVDSLLALIRRWGKKNLEARP